MSLGEALRAVVAAERVLLGELDRVRYASDASFYRLIPSAVVRAASLDEVGAIFAVASRLSLPVTFRAAGTSLSGQAITDGILVDVSRHWRRLEALERGAKVRVQPGVIGGAVNRALARFGRRMGPDPASIDTCMMGGILANNSSGMCCGVRDNAYHTVDSMTFMLADGTLWDSSRDGPRFAQTALARELGGLRDRVRNDASLVASIRRKYQIKNTTGYALNAFLDHDDPLQILTRLMIGSEGTLGFIAEAVLTTVPDPPMRLTGLLVFPSVRHACDAIAPLSAAGASALELMDRASLASVEAQPGIPAAVRGLGPSAAALLVEIQSDREVDPGAIERAAVGLELLGPPLMASDARDRQALWKIRKGLYPSVGAVREPGTTVIIEDFAVPVDRLGMAVDDLHRLFAAHGYAKGIVFGHARDGNLHFVITQSFNEEAEVARYGAFIEDVVEMIAGHDGSLKAEHGTGRNMAPFVEREWGGAAVGVMRALKALVDPRGILNPGVILTDDRRAHVHHLKDCPLVDPIVDRCIECGFCEPRCPSRDLTMTPRQRIVALREMARGTRFEKAFAYPGEATCAADGMCATACPVGIDTGQMIKRLRGRDALRGEIARHLARRFRWVERGARVALLFGRLLGRSTVNLLVRAAELLLRVRLPRMPDPVPLPAPSLPATPRRGDFVYFPTCVSRIMGPSHAGAPSVPELLVLLAKRAGVSLVIPEGLEGTCCGMPFASKGFPEAAGDILARTMAVLGEGTVVVDNSSCAFTMRADGQGRVMDVVDFAHDVLMPRLRIRPVGEAVAVHPVCSLVKAGGAEKLLALARACAVKAEVPEGAGCCGTAGDRGLMYPELPAAAMGAEKLDRYTMFCSSNRMCEVGMTEATGKSFGTFLALLERASRAPR